MGEWQTVKTLIRCCILQHLIWVNTVCSNLCIQKGRVAMGTYTRFKLFPAYSLKTNSPVFPGSNVDGMIQYLPRFKVTLLNTLLDNTKGPDATLSSLSCMRYFLLISVCNKNEYITQACISKRVSQSNFDGSNIFGTMEMCWRHG